MSVSLSTFGVLGPPKTPSVNNILYISKIKYIYNCIKISRSISSLRMPLHFLLNCSKAKQNAKKVPENN